MTGSIHNNTVFWKEVNRLIKVTAGKEEGVKAEDGTVVIKIILLSRDGQSTLRDTKCRGG